MLSMGNLEAALHICKAMAKNLDGQQGYAPEAVNSQAIRDMMRGDSPPPASNFLLPAAQQSVPHQIKSTLKYRIRVPLS